MNMTEAEKQATLNWCDEVYRSLRATSVERNVANGFRQLLSENASLQSLLTETQNCRDRAIETVNKLEKENAFLKSENTKAKLILDEFKKLADENASLKADIATITQEHSANNADLMKENAELRNKYKKALEYIGVRGKKISSLNSDIMAESAKVEDVKKEKAELNNAYDEQTDLIRELVAQRHSLSQENAELRAVIDNRICEKHQTGNEGRYGYEDGDGVTKTGGGCAICIGERVDAENAELKEQNARLVEMLERLEYQSDKTECPDCHIGCGDGHENSCPLGQLLAEVRKEKGK